MKVVVYGLVFIVGLYLAYAFGRTSAGDREFTPPSESVPAGDVGKGGTEFGRTDSALRIEKLEELVETMASGFRSQRQKNAIVRERYEMLTTPEALEALRIGFDQEGKYSLPLITSRTYEFWGVSQTDEARIRELNSSMIENLLSWEAEHVEEIEIEQSGDYISLHLPERPQGERKELEAFRTAIRGILGDRNFDLIEQSMADAIERFCTERWVSLELTEKGVIPPYYLRVSEIREGGNRGYSGTQKTIPPRFRHLFGKEF